MQKAWKYWRLFWVLTSSGWKCQVLTKLFCQSRWWGGCYGSDCRTWTGDASHTAGQPHHSSLQPKPTGAVSPVTCQLPASTSVIGWKKRAKTEVTWNGILCFSCLPGWTRLPPRGSRRTWGPEPRITSCTQRVPKTWTTAPVWCWSLSKHWTCSG